MEKSFHYCKFNCSSLTFILRQMRDSSVKCWKMCLNPVCFSDIQLVWSYCWNVPDTISNIRGCDTRRREKLHVCKKLLEWPTQFIFAADPNHESTKITSSKQESDTNLFYFFVCLILGFVALRSLKIQSFAVGGTWHDLIGVFILYMLSLPWQLAQPIRNERYCISRHTNSSLGYWMVMTTTLYHL